MDPRLALIAMSTPSVALRYAAAFFFAVVAVASAYALFKAAKALERVDKVLADVDEQGIPLMHKAGATLDGVNANLGNVDEITKDVAGITDKPSVFYELDSTDPAKPYTAGPGSYVDLLIARAGGTNVGAALQGQWVQMSLEQLVVANPHFILLGDAAYGATPASLTTRHGWETLSAIKENRVLVFDDNTVSRPGPRLVDGLEALAKILHPELFK